MTATAELATYASELVFDDLPEAVVVAAKRVTLDLLGVALMGRDYPPGKAIVDYVRLQGGGGQASVIGTDVVVSTADAALANGTFAANIELDDVHPSSNLHASSVFVPAILATGEARQISGAEWLTSLVAAYDVGCRVSKALNDSKQYERGFHPTSVSGAFGAAAGSARALRLDPGAMAEAIGLAAVQASGLLTWKNEPGHYAKSFQSGMAARNGVVAAELVAAGFHGPLDSLDGSINIFEPFSTREDFGPLTEELGTRFEIEESGFKFYGCCRAIHSVLDSVFEIMQRDDATVAGNIDEIVVRLPGTMIPIIDNHDLLTHNLQYVVSVAVHDRQFGPEQMLGDRRGDPSIAGLAGKVRLVADDELQRLYPQHWPAQVEVRRASGGALEASRTDPLGTVYTPVNDRDIEDKFRSLNSGILSEDAIERVFSDVRNLERLDSVSTLLGHLRGENN